ncbi:MAG TPA: cupredoxin domain-containing protein [Bacteroidia bacterium]|nr:cupredoxin domain-containing protein [Bacteroidia bacterium]
MKRDKKMVFVVYLCAVFAIATSACKKQDPGTPGENEIFLEYKTFHPTQLAVQKGTTVTFINKDNADHTVTSTTKLFDSGRIRSGDSYTFTFNDAGVFYFYCNYHSSNSQEQGAILVK